MATRSYWLEWFKRGKYHIDGAEGPGHAVAEATARFEGGASHVRIIGNDRLLLDAKSRHHVEFERNREDMDLATWETMVVAYAKRNGYRVGEVYWRAHSLKFVRESPHPPYGAGHFRAYVHRDGKRYRLWCRWIPEVGWRAARA